MWQLRELERLRRFGGLREPGSPYRAEGGLRGLRRFGGPRGLWMAVDPGEPSWG